MKNIQALSKKFTQQFLLGGAIFLSLSTIHSYGATQDGDKLCADLPPDGSNLTSSTSTPPLSNVLNNDEETTNESPNIDVTGPWPTYSAPFEVTLCDLRIKVLKILERKLARMFETDHEQEQVVRKLERNQVKLKKKQEERTMLYKKQAVVKNGNEEKRISKEMDSIFRDELSISHDTSLISHYISLTSAVIDSMSLTKRLTSYHIGWIGKNLERSPVIQAHSAQ